MKWLFNVETHMDSNKDTCIASPATKGYTHTLGIEQDETFMNVAEMKTNRSPIAIVVYYDH
jgi:hypothetical protein